MYIWKEKNMIHLEMEHVFCGSFHMETKKKYSVPPCCSEIVVIPVLSCIFSNLN